MGTPTSSVIKANVRLNRDIKTIVDELDTRKQAIVDTLDSYKRTIVDLYDDKGITDILSLTEHPETGKSGGSAYTENIILLRRIWGLSFQERVKKMCVASLPDKLESDEEKDDEAKNDIFYNDDLWKTGPEDVNNMWLKERLKLMPNFRPCVLFQLTSVTD